MIAHAAAHESWRRGWGYTIPQGQWLLTFTLKHSLNLVVLRDKTKNVGRYYWKLLRRWLQYS